MSPRALSLIIGAICGFIGFPVLLIVISVVFNLVQWAVG